MDRDPSWDLCYTQGMLGAHCRCVAISMLLMSCGAPAYKFARPYVPAQPKAVDWPDTGAVVIDDTATLSYESIRVGATHRLVAVLDRVMQIKILTHEGLKQAAFALPIDDFSSISEVAGRSVSPRGRIVYMAAHEPRAVKAKGHGAPAPALKKLIFSVPEPTVGGVIDVRYKRVYTAPELVPPWVFGSHLPTIRSELRVLLRPGFYVDYRYGRGEHLADAQPLRVQEGDQTHLAFVERDLPALYKEPFEAHHSRIAPWVATVLTKVSVANYQLRTWDDVAMRIRRMFQKVGPWQGEGTPPERFATIRDGINASLMPGLGVLRPVSAKQLMRGVPACSRDAAALLLAAMQGADVKAYPALVTSAVGPPVLDGFPSLYPFVRAVVAVDVKKTVAEDASCTEDPISRGLLCSVPADSYAFLDPTCRYCRFGELPRELTGGRALVLLPKGPKWFTIPKDPPERNRTLVQARYQLDVDGTLSGNLAAEITGAGARSIRTAVGNRMTRKEKDESVARVLFGADASLRISQVSMKDRTDPSRPLTFQAHITSQVTELGRERFRINQADLVGRSWPGRWRRSRRFPAVLPAPAWIETVATIKLPVGYEVQTGPITKFVEPFAEYAAGFALRNRTLHFSRRLVIKEHVMTPAMWRHFYDFLKRIEQFEQSGPVTWFQER